MNDAPHVHSVDVRQDYYGAKRWSVEYGDTKVRFASRFADPSSPRFEKKMKKAVAKAIRQHDEGSIIAGEWDQAVRQRREEAAKMVALSPWYEEAKKREEEQKKREEERLHGVRRTTRSLSTRDGAVIDETVIFHTNVP